MSSAELCRSNGWGPGTVLEGREAWPGRNAWGEARIVITAIGEEGVLARKLARRSFDNQMWRLVSASEALWSLEERDWRRVPG